MHSGPLCGVSEAVTHAYAEEYPVGILEVLILDFAVEHQVIADEVVDTATHVEADLHFAVTIDLDVDITHVGTDVIDFPESGTDAGERIETDLVAQLKQVVLLGVEVKAGHTVLLEVVIARNGRTPCVGIVALELQTHTRHAALGAKHKLAA